MQDVRKHLACQRLFNVIDFSIFIIFEEDFQEMKKNVITSY